MENFDREILTNCWKFVKFVNIFPCQNFAPYGKSLSLKQTRVTNSTNESAKKTKELDERFNSDVTLDQDELSAGLAQGSAH